MGGMDPVAGIENMQLLGKGEAYYLKFIKVYDAALYGEDLVEKKDILDKNISKCLLLQYSVDIGADDFITAANTVLARQFSTKQLGEVSRELEILHGGYQDVKKGDQYTLCYFKAAETTTLALNGEELVAVSSADFSEIYFSIWLGKTNPLDEKLRTNLLANSSKN